MGIMEVTEVIHPSFVDRFPIKASDDSHAMSYSTAEMSSSDSHSNRGVPGLEDNIYTLGRRTECLIRNMRFDNVVLQSHDEDMRATLLELGDELRALEKLIGESPPPPEKPKSEENNKEEVKVTSENSVDFGRQDSMDVGVETTEKVPTFNPPARRRGREKKDIFKSKNHLDFGDDSASNDGLDSIDLSTLTGATGQVNPPGEPPLRRLFQWGKKAEQNDRRRLSSSICSTDDETNSAPAAPLWGRRDRSKPDNKKPNPFDEESVISNARSVSSAPIFQLFGRDGNKERRRHSEVVGPGGNLFKRIFHRNTMDCQNGVGFAITEIVEEIEGCDKDKDKPKVPDAEELQTLDLKLQGCDLAKSSLEELHSIQARNLLDMQRDHTHSQIDYEVESSQIDSELEDLRMRFAFCQKENKRRQRILKESMGKAKKANDREELLLEEVECVRTELFALNRELNQCDGFGS